MIIAAAVCAAVGAITSIPALRLGAFAIAVVTLMYADVVASLALHFRSFTGGGDGLNVDAANIPLSRMWLYSALVALVAYILHRNLLRGPFGRALMITRRGEAVAASLAVATGKHKIVAFTIYATFAGVAGGLYQQLNGPIARRHLQHRHLDHAAVDGGARRRRVGLRCVARHHRADGHPDRAESGGRQRRPDQGPDLRRHPAGGRAGRAPRSGRLFRSIGEFVRPRLPVALANRPTTHGRRRPRQRPQRGFRRRVRTGRPARARELLAAGRGGSGETARGGGHLPHHRRHADPARCVDDGRDRAHRRSDRTERLRQDDAAQLHQRAQPRCRADTSGSAAARSTARPAPARGPGSAAPSRPPCSPRKQRSRPTS